MVNKAHSLSRDELIGILSSYTGFTTADGAVTKNSLIDSKLIGAKQEAVVGKLVQVLSGACISQQSIVSTFNTATGEVTFTPAMSDRILSGTVWRLANIGTGGGGGGGGSGTASQASVDAGFLAGAKDATVAKHADLLVPGPDSLANVLSRDVAGDKTDVATPDNMSALASASQVAELKRILLRLSADAFSATIQGVARVELDTMMEQLATYLVAAGGAMSLQVNNNAARTNLQQIINDIDSVLGIDGVNIFNPTIQGAARLTLNAALAQLATYISAAGAAFSQTINPGSPARTNMEQCFKDLSDMLAGAGITNYPGASAPGNGVSAAAVLHYISDLLTAMLVLTETGGTLTADGNEQNMIINNAPVGVFKPLTIKLSLINMVASDTIEVRVYDRLSALSDLEQVDYKEFIGVSGGLPDGNTAIYITLKENRHGFKVTLKQTSALYGVYKDFVWELIQEI